jgi:ABC-type bacteriocin/lantibiotic exporter with double-glycine peptidase domain
MRPDLEQETSSTERTGTADLKIENGEFKWDPKGKANLSNINLEISNGQLIMVAGRVGSGKSSLAMAVLGEIPQTGGKRKLSGSIAYVPQEAWIMNATLKDNILFGEPFDEDKYQRVIQASALGPDLAQLPNGDKTEIGERGITLSGGQKQRVSIARALYSDRDLYVLDDPFSAVDSHVGLHLFENALRGYLRNKTILFITNQLQYLPYADVVYTLKDGEFENHGTFKDLMETSKSFQDMMASFGKVESKKADEPKKADGPKAEIKPSAPSEKQCTSK